VHLGPQVVGTLEQVHLEATQGLVPHQVQVTLEVHLLGHLVAILEEHLVGHLEERLVATLEHLGHHNKDILGQLEPLLLAMELPQGREGAILGLLHLWILR